jgi:hypothetical protein
MTLPDHSTRSCHIGHYVKTKKYLNFQDKQRKNTCKRQRWQGYNQDFQQHGLRDIIKQTGSNSKVSDIYSGGVWFESYDIRYATVVF